MINWRLFWFLRGSFNLLSCRDLTLRFKYIKFCVKLILISLIKVKKDIINVISSADGIFSPKRSDDKIKFFGESGRSSHLTIDDAVVKNPTADPGSILLETPIS